LEEARKALPNSPEVAYHLAVGLKAKGDTTGSLQLVDAALASQQYFVERAEAETFQRSLRAN
jgi:hypothetical protein